MGRWLVQERKVEIKSPQEYRTETGERTNLKQKI